MEKFYKILLRVEVLGKTSDRFISDRIATRSEAMVAVTNMFTTALENRESITIIQVRECLADDDWNEIMKVRIDASSPEI